AEDLTDADELALEVDGSGVAEQVADEAVQPRRLLVEDAEERLAVGGLHLTAAQRRDGVGDDGQRGADLVRDHRRELAAGRELLLAHELLLLGAERQLRLRELAGAALELRRAALDGAHRGGAAIERRQDERRPERREAERGERRAGDPPERVEGI